MLAREADSKPSRTKIAILLDPSSTQLHAAFALRYAVEMLQPASAGFGQRKFSRGTFRETSELRTEANGINPWCDYCYVACFACFYYLPSFEHVTDADCFMCKIIKHIFGFQFYFCHEVSDTSNVERGTPAISKSISSDRNN